MTRKQVTWAQGGVKKCLRINITLFIPTQFCYFLKLLLPLGFISDFVHIAGIQHLVDAGIKVGKVKGSIGFRYSEEKSLKPP